MRLYGSWSMKDLQHRLNRSPAEELVYIQIPVLSPSCRSSFVAMPRLLPQAALAAVLTLPAGKAMFQMLGVFAEFDRSIIQERVRAGLQRAKPLAKIFDNMISVGTTGMGD
jgi:Resolvase, N terminal domain